MRRLFPLVLPLVLIGCSLDDFRSQRGRRVDPARQEYAPALGIEIGRMTRTGSGLYYRDVETGNGPEATPGRMAVVHYTGWLPSGTKFDSSRDSGQPFAFQVGGGQVIRGWDEGVAGMRVGGRRQLVIPSELGYGANGVGPIPANSTLVFEVELLDLR